MESIVNAVVENMLQGSVEKARQYIVESGLGRWTIKKWNVQNNDADFAEFLGYSAVLEKLLLTGISDFVVHRLCFDLMNSKVNFDVSIPELILSVDKGEIDLKFFGANSSGKAAGVVTILEPRITGEANINLTDNYDYALRSLKLRVKLKAIKSEVNVKMNDTDYSKTVNAFLMTTIPGYLKKYERQINEAIAKGILQILK